jgi:hypothetical protein
MAQFVERYHATRTNNSPLKPMTADDSFTYAVGRAVSTWPQINGNSAAFCEEDFGQTRGLKSVIGTDDGFKFGLVNANHSVGPGKMNHVLGTIRDEVLVSGSGVDIMAQIDKRACEAFEIGPEEFASGGDYCDISIEIACDRDRSTFVALTNPSSKKLEDQTVFTAEEAAAQGISRTSYATSDPYLYQGKHMVVELCSPVRCRGVALLPDPADKTANIFEVAASLETSAKKFLTEGGDYADPGFREDKKKRYPLDTPDHVRSAAKFWGIPTYRSQYTSEQQSHISSKIEAAKKKFGIGDEENSGFASTDSPSVDDMMGSYDDIDSVDASAATGNDMPDSAFADTYFDPEEDGSKRAYPLYASAGSYANRSPHKGLVKAALQAHADGKMKNPSLALQRLQVAHSQLHGAKSMDDKEKLATEVADLKNKLAEVQASKEEAVTTVSAKDTEIAALNESIKTLSDEKAALEGKIAARDAEEKANQRLAKLTEVDGFAVADEEKAALLESLKTEDELAFENRVLKVKIASMEEAAKKAKTETKTDEEKAALRVAEENAALQGIDFVPNGLGAAKTKIEFAELI